MNDAASNNLCPHGTPDGCGICWGVRPRCWAHMSYPAHIWTCSQPASHEVLVPYEDDDRVSTCAPHIELTKSYVRLGDPNDDGSMDPMVVRLDGHRVEPWPNHQQEWDALVESRRTGA